MLHYAAWRRIMLDIYEENADTAKNNFYTRLSYRNSYQKDPKALDVLWFEGKKG